ncbi:MAG: hypothetical protein ABR499_08210 [Gemmatimonadaceae bacterium]
MEELEPATAEQQPIWRRAFLVGAIVGVVGAALSGPPGFALVAAGGTAVAAIVLVVERWARDRLQRRMPPGWRPLPSFGFLAWGVLPTFFAGLALAADPVRPAALLLAAFALAWWVIGILLVRGARRALVPALALAAVPWLIVLALEVRRVAFVVREGGMEAAYGYGSSPAELLLYWALEGLIIFVPLGVIAVRLGRALGRGTVQPAAD